MTTDNVYANAADEARKAVKRERWLGIVTGLDDGLPIVRRPNESSGRTYRKASWYTPTEGDEVMMVRFGDSPGEWICLGDIG